MANSQPLSASNLRYLMVMKGLSENGRGVRCTDVATELGLSKPSVHNMMHTFRDMGIIRKDAYGASFFTQAGTELVQRYSKYADALSELLSEYFPQEAHDLRNARAGPGCVPPAGPRKINMSEILRSPSFWYGVEVMAAAGLLIFGGKRLIQRLLCREEAERMKKDDPNHTEN